MFKLQINWFREGEWFDCVYPPAEYATSLFRYKEYSARHPEHQYRIIKTLVK